MCGSTHRKRGSKKLPIFLCSFYRSASMQSGLSDKHNVRPSVRLSVCPSVRPSNAYIVKKKRQKRMPKLFTTLKKILSFSFLTGIMVGMG